MNATWKVTGELMRLVEILVYQYRENPAWYSKLESAGEYNEGSAAPIIRRELTSRGRARRSVHAGGEVWGERPATYVRTEKEHLSTQYSL